MNGQLQQETVDISVVVPTYNRAAVLKGCLEAIARQSFPQNRFEVIVVDDGSADLTHQVCEQAKLDLPSLRVRRQQNRGPAAARNAGMRLARGRIVAFTDDDCVPPPEWLERVNQAFATDDELVGLGGIMITPPRQWVPLTHHSDLTESGAADYSRFIGTNNAAYRREVLLAVNGFDETFRHVSVEDAELFIRVRRLGRTMIDPHLYVLHPPRDMSFMEAVRGYVRFYEGYVALQQRFPEDFRDIYGGATPESAVMKGRSWGARIRRYIPGMFRHPWRGLQFAAYLVTSRALVTSSYLRRNLRAGS
jgi:glycosyltransferase involved in cell wall biosynthesis